jgi:AcrR family transcriptional regulator
MVTEAPRAARARDRVLRASMDIIVERGLDRVRLAEIARRANMSEGHVLYYFGTKNRILAETLVWSEAGVTVRRREALAAAAVGWDQLRVFVHYYLPRDYEDPVWALWVEAWARRHIEEQAAPLRETSETWRHELLEILAGGREVGAFAEGPASFPNRLIALMNGFAIEILERTADREGVLEAVLEQCHLELDPRPTKEKAMRSSAS